MDRARLRVSKDEVIIEEGDTSLLGKLMKGSLGRITIATPFGVREIHKVKDTKGRIFKDDLRPRKIKNKGG